MGEAEKNNKQVLLVGVLVLAVLFAVIYFAGSNANEPDILDQDNTEEQVSTESTKLRMAEQYTVDATPEDMMRIQEEYERIIREAELEEQLKNGTEPSPIE